MQMIGVRQAQNFAIDPVQFDVAGGARDGCGNDREVRGEHVSKFDNASHDARRMYAAIPREPWPNPALPAVGNFHD
ncbi:MAG: hypothetical protein ACREPK_06595 [Rhodanobacteraceae bacterium]